MQWVGSGASGGGGKGVVQRQQRLHGVQRAKLGGHVQGEEALRPRARRQPRRLRLHQQLQHAHVVVLGGEVRGRHAAAAGVQRAGHHDGGAVVQQVRHQRVVPALGGQVQDGVAVVVAVQEGVARDGAVCRRARKHRHHRRGGRVHGGVQRRVAAPVRRKRHAAIQQLLHSAHVAVLRRHMQWCEPRGIGGGAQRRDAGTLPVVQGLLVVARQQRMHRRHSVAPRRVHQ